MNVAVTGPTKPSADMRDGIRAAIGELSDRAVLGGGCAHGIDTVAFHAAHGRLPLHAFPPAAHHNPAAALLAEFCTRPIPGEAEPYRQRNQRMIHWADELIACSWSDTFYRSGTWMTINMALRKGIPVDLRVFEPIEDVLPR